MLNNDKAYEDLSIKQIIARDIKKYSEEMNIPVRQLLKEFAKNTNVVFRTLERIFEENRNFTPNVRTVVDIYSQLYNVDSLAEIITKTPPVISEFIKKNHTQFIVGVPKLSDLSITPSLHASLTSSSTFNQIYLMTAGDYGTDISIIREKFGSNGLKHLDEMIKLGFVEMDENDQIKRKRRLTWDRAVRKNFVKTLITDVYNEENSDLENPNHLSVAIGDVTPSDYDLILGKMKSNYQEILLMINNSKPTYNEAIRISVAQLLEKTEFKVEGDKLC
ncbi:MAG: hypothetical protein EHM20_07765 [Alphaproteobacteria bacterium]|nr:MAG: hypothetical protein EHM20_07765 [Alphaproteobacteria bacterium]